MSKLKVNYRNFERSKDPKLNLELFLDENKTIFAIEDDLELGKIVLSTNLNLDDKNTYNKAITYRGQHLVDWELNFVRNDGDINIYILKHKNYPDTGSFSEIINNFQFLDSLNTVVIKNESKDYKFFFEQLIDFPFGVKAKIHINNSIYTGTLLAEELKNPLQMLSFEIYEQISKEINGFIICEINLLNSRYFFKVESNRIIYDSDFDTLDINLPTEIIGITQRSAPRLNNTSIEIELNYLDQKIIASLINISMNGCLINTQNQQISNFHVGEIVKCEIKSILCSFKIVRINEFHLYIAPVESAQQKFSMFYSACLNYSYTPRVMENYPDFLKLYEEVGYSSYDSSWPAKTIETWKKQDDSFFGNYWGGYKNEKLASGVGVVNYTKNSIYCHSVCMIKEPIACLKLFNLMGIILGQMQTNKNHEYFVGSFSKSSKFTTTMFTSFQLLPSPVKHYTEHTLTISRINSIPNYTQGCEIKRSSNLNTSSHLKNIFSNDDLEVHSFFLNDGLIGDVVVLENYPEFATASNITRTAFVFNYSIDNYAEFANEIFFNFESVEYIEFVGVESIPNKTMGDLSFYTLTHSSVSHLLMASIYQSFYSLARKFKSEINDEILKAFAA